MQTDPISAATAYRMAFEAIVHAPSLSTAVAAATKALAITFTPPEDGMISISSGYGHRTKTPFVTLSLANASESANPTIQMSSAEARRQALYILEAADAADADGFIVEWLRGTAELSENQIGALLSDFRTFRDIQRTKDESN
jgi:hypothetical protein